MAEQHDILWAIMKDSERSASAKCVATVLLLKFRNHDTLVCNPSFTAIAARVGRKRRSVIDAVNELKAAGWLDWTGTLGGSSENTNNFTFNLEPQPVQSAAPVQSTTPVQSAAQTGAAERTRPVQRTAHELSIELSKNHEREKPARATLIPDDFEISEETLAWAITKLGTNDAVDRSVKRFHNHFLQLDGTRAKCRDWNARLRNWIDDDASKKSQADGVARLGRSAEANEPTDGAWDAALSVFVKFGRWTKHVDQFGPAPGEPGCRVPRNLLAKHSINIEVAA